MKISDPLISWYKNNKRDLPWRNTNNLYHIWVSEVILQQTRVAQGLQYYYNFLERFPGRIPCGILELCKDTLTVLKDDCPVAGLVRDRAHSGKFHLMEF